MLWGVCCVQRLKGGNRSSVHHKAHTLLVLYTQTYRKINVQPTWTCMFLYCGRKRIIQRTQSELYFILFDLKPKCCILFATSVQNWTKTSADECDTNHTAAKSGQSSSFLLFSKDSKATRSFMWVLDNYITPDNEDKTSFCKQKHIADGLHIDFQDSFVVDLGPEISGSVIHSFHTFIPIIYVSNLSCLSAPQLLSFAHPVYVPSGRGRRRRGHRHQPAASAGQTPRAADRPAEPRHVSPLNDTFMTDLHFKAAVWPTGEVFGLFCRGKTVSPLCLAPFFRLLRVCEAQENQGDLEGVDALLSEEAGLLISFYHGSDLALKMTICLWFVWLLPEHSLRRHPHRHGVGGGHGESVTGQEEVPLHAAVPHHQLVQRGTCKILDDDDDEVFPRREI